MFGRSEVAGKREAFQVDEKSTRTLAPSGLLLRDAPTGKDLVAGPKVGGDDPARAVRTFHKRVYGE